MPLEAEQTPGFAYPTHVTSYDQTNIGAINPLDTEGHFRLISPSLRPIYTLPGIPYDQSVNPTEKLLICTSSAGSIDASSIVAVLDYLKQPAPTLGDFRAVWFWSVGDFARVRWNGSLWVLVETGGPTVQVVVVGQTFPTIPT